MTPTGSFVNEIEPNNTSATAQALTGTSVRLRGNIQIGTDQDYYSFTAAAGDRVYTAAQTSFSAGSGLTIDATIDVLGTDGTTVLESDDDDGSLGSLSPSIAGLTLTAAGTYYLRVVHSTPGPLASEIHPYDLYLRLQSGSPTAESEPNNNGSGTPNPFPPSGWVSGTVDPAADNDMFSISLAAGDTVFLSLDADPERDATTFNPRLAFGIFDGLLLLANDGSVASPNSEAFFFTVRDAGTYVAYVDEAAAGGSAGMTYRLSASVYPQETLRTNTTYTSTDVPKTIGPGASLVSSTLTVPGNPKIGNLRVGLNISFDGTPAQTGELDISLVAPDGNEVVLVDDPLSSTATTPQIDYTLDDEAGLPTAVFPVNKIMIYQPEGSGRLFWFKNQNAGGTWTLNVWDDTANTNGGTLNGWSITVGEDRPIPACLVSETTEYSSDFEADDGGFTHSGTADEWERGLPTFAPITTAHSGANAWKTDLDNTYNVSSNQELVSPTINLTALSGQRITFDWAMKYQIEGAHWDHATVEVREVGGSGLIRKYFEHRGPSLTRNVGAASTPANTAAGWGVWQADMSEFAGKNVQLVFHFDSDSSVNFAGLAIDDVKVSACASPPTAVRVRSFTARRSPSGVTLRWRTASELDVLGYNVYGQAQGKRVKLNRSLIASTSGARGGAYRFAYRGSRSFGRFWLQAVAANGSRSWFGPATG